MFWLLFTDKSSDITQILRDVAKHFTAAVKVLRMRTNLSNGREYFRGIFLLLVWLLEQQDAYTLVPASWHGRKGSIHWTGRPAVSERILQLQFASSSTLVDTFALALLNHAEIVRGPSPPRNWKHFSGPCFSCSVKLVYVSEKRVWSVSRIKARLKMPPSTRSSNRGSCLSNAEWVLNCEDGQENRLMSVQEADVLQRLGRRFNARESISHILLLSERAKNQLFFLSIFTTLWFSFYVIIDTFLIPENHFTDFNLHPWAPAV